MSRHSPKEIERCKRIAAKMTIKNLAQGSLAAPSGSASTCDILNEKWESEAQLLDEVAKEHDKRDDWHSACLCRERANRLRMCALELRIATDGLGAGEMTPNDPSSATAAEKRSD